MAEFRTPQPIGTVLPTIAVIGTIATQVSQPNIAIASLVGSVGSPVAVAGGTVGTVQSLANLAIASLVGSLSAQSNIAVASLVGSVGSPVALAGGTVGTLQALANMAIASLVSLVGSVQSMANPAIASLVGSIGSPVVLAGGTVGTIQSGVVSATIIGGNVPDVGTVGTVLSAVAVQQAFPPTGVVATASGTIRGASGTLYGVLASAPYSQTSTIAATMLIYAFPGTVGNGTIPWEMVLPPGQFSHWEFNRGLAYTGSLVASIMGTVNALFLT